jgi:hypothetical protein
MDSSYHTGAHKYDTFIPLDYPPMKIGNVDIPQNAPAIRPLTSNTAAGSMVSNNHKAQPVAAEGF